MEIWSTRLTKELIPDASCMGASLGGILERTDSSNSNNMPGVDGFETCRRIRESSDVPIIMVTVRGNKRDKVAALDAGADDYLVKPFGTQELLARVQAAVRRVPGAEEIPPFISPNLNIDFERRRVVAHGQPVHLTPTEFELLKHLVLNRESQCLI
jgi:two-component system KDP operon response regulator KdpE